MDKLETITKQDANKLVLGEIKGSLIKGGLDQCFTMLGIVAMTKNNSLMPELVKIPLGLFLISMGILFTYNNLKSGYDTARSYISNPVTHIKEAYNMMFLEDIPADHKIKEIAIW